MMYPTKETNVPMLLQEIKAAISTQKQKQNKKTKFYKINQMLPRKNTQTSWLLFD